MELFTKLGKQIDSLFSRKDANVGSFDPNLLDQQLFQMFGQNLKLLPYEAHTYINEGYLINPHVYTVINNIIRPASAIPHYVYEIKKDKRKDFLRYKSALDSGRVDEAEYYALKSLELVEIPELTNLLTDPNEKQSFQEFQEAGIGYELLTGNGFIYGLKPFGFNGFTKMYNMPSQITSIVTGTWENPIKGYQISYGNMQTDLIDVNDVCHIKYFNPQQGSNSFSGAIGSGFFQSSNYGLYGLSPMSSLCRVVKRNNDGAIAQMKILENGYPVGVLSSESERGNADQAIAFKEAFKKEYQGASNKNKIVVTSMQLKWLQMGMNTVDMQLLDADKADLESIARVYSVPLPIVLNDASSYNNIKQAEKALWERAIIPVLSRRRDALNRWLLPAYNKKTKKQLYIDYDLSSIQSLKQDEKDKVAIVKDEIMCGTLTPNEGRLKLGRNLATDPLLDKYYIANNLRSIDQPNNDKPKD